MYNRILKYPVVHLHPQIILCLQSGIVYLCLRLFPGDSFGRKHSFVRYLKIPNDKNKKSCDQNDETFWSHDLTKIEIAFEISCGDVDSLVIFVINAGKRQRSAEKRFWIDTKQVC